MSIFRQSLKKLAIPSPLIRRYSQNPLKPPLGMCPEELNFRQDDEHREQIDEYEEENKEPCKEHKQLVPNLADMEKFKDFELKSRCTKYHLNTEGFYWNM